MYRKYNRIKSLQDYLMWKRAKAEHRLAVIKEKRESLIKLALSFNSRTSKAIIYENLRKIKNTPKRKTNILKEGNQYTQRGKPILYNTQ